MYPSEIREKRRDIFQIEGDIERWLIDRLNNVKWQIFPLQSSRSTISGTISILMDHPGLLTGVTHWLVNDCIEDSHTICQPNINLQFSSPGGRCLLFRQLWRCILRIRLDVCAAHKKNRFVGVPNLAFGPCGQTTIEVAGRKRLYLPPSMRNRPTRGSSISH